MVYSCNYPILHTFNAEEGDLINYTILIGDTDIYRGKIFPYSSADETVKIDISEVCREYVETFYEKLTWSGLITGNVPSDGLVSTALTFTIESEQNLSGENEHYTVVYDYNDNYSSNLDEIRGLNAPIDTRVDPRQRIWITGVNLTGASQNYGYRITSNTLSNYPVAGSVYQVLSVDLSTLTLKAGDTIDLVMGTLASPVETYSYTVVGSCHNRYVLYYVNKYGGMDSLLCTGRAIRSWSPARTDVKLYGDRSHSLSWKQKRISQEIDRQYELNTGLLTQEGAARIDHLIYSPKVFIHDLTNDRIATCLVTDTGYSEKQRPYALPQYTFSVRESQKHFRR
ncbi:MAG: lytic polysaccharide monooxygenase auxiliary activity family 9 protein [Bacteroides sp.]|nr:lytic polysaccharide monooxygenase auxiliary activity family 9 protein [Bacteroides sp.]